MNWRAIAAGAVLGAVVPGLFLVYFAISPHGTDAVLLFWPSSVMLMGSETMPATEEWRTLIPSVLINVALYAFLAWALTSLRREGEDGDAGGHRP